MKILVCAIALSTVFYGLPASAATTVVAKVDLSQQRMNVYVGGVIRYTWAVSTGRGRYRTPTGTWSAKWLSPKHRSRKYHNAPMPWSVFYNGGYAVHGTNEISGLGTPRSHGCIRLHPDNARIFFQLVQANGKQNTKVQVVN
jgi:lipoprotein-anchoring transpeptidase ErfK/SrfK